MRRTRDWDVETMDIFQGRYLLTATLRFRHGFAFSFNRIKKIEKLSLWDTLWFLRQLSWNIFIKKLLTGKIVQRLSRVLGSVSLNPLLSIRWLPFEQNLPRLVVRRTKCKKILEILLKPNDATEMRLSFIYQQRFA